MSELREEWIDEVINRLLTIRRHMGLRGAGYSHLLKVGMENFERPFNLMTLHYGRNEVELWKEIKNPEMKIVALHDHMKLLGDIRPLLLEKEVILEMFHDLMTIINYYKNKSEEFKSE